MILFLLWHKPLAVKARIHLVNECMALHRKSSKANRWQDVYGTLGRLLSMSEQGLAEVK